MHFLDLPHFRTVVITENGLYIQLFNINHFRKIFFNMNDKTSQSE